MKENGSSFYIERKDEEIFCFSLKKKFKSKHHHHHFVLFFLYLNRKLSCSQNNDIVVLKEELIHILLTQAYVFNLSKCNTYNNFLVDDDDENMCVMNISYKLFMLH